MALLIFYLALSLLPDPIPQRSDYRILAATLNFHQNNFSRTANLLVPLYRAEENVLSVDHLYMLAESLFELGESGESRELFSRLAETSRYRSTARHRLTLLSILFVVIDFIGLLIVIGRNIF